MLELADFLLPVLRAGEPVAVVTVIRVARSAPRGPGAAMAVRRDGSVIGSISGGCVEGDAVLLATQVLATGRGVVASLGFSDEAAHAAGLACGGSVDVVVHRIDPGDEVARTVLDIGDGQSARVGLVVSGPAVGRLVAGDGLPDGTRILEAAYDGADVFVVQRDPRRRLVIAGAGEHAIALCRVASSAGFAVTVCDVWERLVTPERFPTAERLAVGAPAEHLDDLVGPDPARATVCVLSHDERVDVPTLAAALRRGVGFVGAMGARGTVAHRAALLSAAGVEAEEIARIHAPLGLDLGGSSPEATAVSALAEIVAAQHGGSARPLRELSGPLHRRAASDACPLPSGVPALAHSV
ncbi:XdhC family protein [Microbacterium lushaniae]|uniref:XdhC family protein n=1 Tax=Microbacterium lushaniae TaxID=2614639 RepID=A0A5J6KZU7_9MICO|nr:XdhC family protein [Microbacterium lushaniae]QEW01740.1 XdhC family protein [Microbacterium lushaniae]